MPDAMLVATRLCKTYKSRARARGASSQQRIAAVDGVSFTVREGTTLGLVGESGSGKSTIGRMLVGLARPDSGTVSIAGRPRTAKSHGGGERVRRAREIQMVFQDPLLSLDPRLTPAQGLGRVLKLHGWRRRATRHDRVRELLDQVGLSSHDGDKAPHQLSGGQRQRVGIAKALAVEPAVLVLDEPVAGLDVSIQAQLLSLLDQLRSAQQMTCVFISHDLAVVRHVADEALVLYSGQVVERGKTEDLLRTPRHPYTRLLLASVPRLGWDPSEAVRLRRELARHLTTARG